MAVPQGLEVVFADGGRARARSSVRGKRDGRRTAVLLGSVEAAGAAVSRGAHRGPQDQPRRHSSPAGPAGAPAVCLPQSGGASPADRARPPRARRSPDRTCRRRRRCRWDRWRESARPAARSLLLLGWGTVVALDLVSVPQAMFARPLVAGTVAGLLAGDVDGRAAAGRAAGAVRARRAAGGRGAVSGSWPGHGGGGGRGRRCAVARADGHRACCSRCCSRCWAAGACSGCATPTRGAAWPGRGARGGERARHPRAAVGRPRARCDPGRSCSPRSASPGRCCCGRSRRCAPRLQGLLAAAAIGCALAAVAGGAARSAGRGPRLHWLVRRAGRGARHRAGLG